MLNTLFLALTLLAPLASGGDPQKPAAPAPAQDEAARARELEIQFQLLSEQYTRSETEWTDQLRLYASDLQKRNELSAKHPVKTYWPRFEALAKDGQGRALVWLAGHAENMFSERAEVAQRKLALFRQLIEQYASAPWGMEIATSLSLQRVWLETKGVEDLLYDFVKKTQNREFAAGALSRVMAILSGAASKGEEQKRADEVRERILREYPETEVAKKLAQRTPASDASLQAGSAAPDFKGKDVDGAEHSLAALRGKVVLLDFWGFWSPASRTMLAHLSELRTRLAAEPFAILGVATDEDGPRFRELSKEQKVGWPSIFEGGRTGPIVKSYKVRAFPTLFLIGADGVIRKIWVTPPSDKALDDEIELALQAARSAKK